MRRNVRLVHLRSPPGTRSEAAGVIGFTDATRTTFAVCGLYQSLAGTGDPARDFEDEWAAFVGKNHKVTGERKSETVDWFDGWKMTMGAAPAYSPAQRTYNVLMVVFTGYGTKATVLITYNDDRHRPAIDKFLASLRLGKPPGHVPGHDTSKVDPTGGAPVPGVVCTPPDGWARTTASRNILFRATLGNVDDNGRPESNNDAAHQATLGVLPIISAGPGGSTALFEQTWKDQFAPFELGDTVVHYRSRLKSGLVVLYMGRFFQRPDAPAANGNPNTYGVLYLVDLGGSRFQPLVALVEPHEEGYGMDQFKETRALRALAFPLGAFLDSIKPKEGSAPYPSGGYFAPGDLQGEWTQSSSAFGGFYVNANTGASAGAAVLSSGGNLSLRPNGTYAYDFAFAAVNPQMGNSSGSSKHAGRYRLDGDIIHCDPDKPMPHDYSWCAVGVGTRRTAAGVKRLLVLVGADSQGVFRAPPLIPNWDNYAGVMTWYSEK